MLDLALTFDDVQLVPKFSFIRSRKEVNTATNFLGLNLKLPIISSNMDTITGVEMCRAMAECGGIGALHRFWTIEENITAFKQGVYRYTDDSGSLAIKSPIAGVGLGTKEMARAEALVDSGANVLVIDIAHAGSIAAVEQYDLLRGKYGSNISIIVGNFCDSGTISSFIFHSKSLIKPDAYKIGIANGSVCTTRFKTGVGVPQFTALLDCVKVTDRIISDGGCKTAGDVAKALAAGARLVMTGSMLAGTDETPGQIVTSKNEEVKVLGGGLAKVEGWTTHLESLKLYKKYRGSASKESYEVQDKVSAWRTPEGESSLVLCKGPVKNILQDIEGGLRSSMSYLNSNNLDQFRRNAKFIQVTNNGVREAGTHGKTTLEKTGDKNTDYLKFERYI